MIQLARETCNMDPEPEFLRRLALAQSNLPEMGDGASIYNRWVAPAFVDLCKVGAHFAISSMFNGDHIVPQYCYSIKSLDYRHAEAGMARLALGIARVSSRITRESRDLRFAAVYLGDQVLHAGVRELEEKEDYDMLVAESMAAFSSGDFGELLRLLDDHFDGMPYSFRALFKDEQKRILDIVLSRTLGDAEASYHQIYEKHGSLMRFLKEMGQPVPDVLRFTAEFVLNSDLKHTFETDPVDFVRIAMLMEMVKREGVQVDEAGARYAAGNALTRILRRLQQNPQDSETLERANVLTSLYPMMPFSVDCWHAQNIYYSILDKVFPRDRPQRRSGIAPVAGTFSCAGRKTQNQRSRACPGNRISNCKLNNQTGQSNEKSDKSHHWRRCRRYAHGRRGGWLRNSFGGPAADCRQVSRASPA